MPRYCVFLTTCLPVLMFCNKICNCVKKKKKKDSFIIFVHHIPEFFFYVKLVRVQGTCHKETSLDIISDNTQAVVFKCPQLILAGKCPTPTTTQHSKSLEYLLFHILMLELQQVTITSSTCLDAGYRTPALEGQCPET